MIQAAFKKVMVTKNLDINDCIAIRTDNASVMVRINNGVHSKLNQENPSLLLMRCACHFIQLAMSYVSANEF